MNDTPETDGEWNRIACYDHPQFEQGIAEFARKLERERDEWKAKYIQQNKDLGCEMMDPNGTIWDYAKTLQRERDDARGQIEANHKAALVIERMVYEARDQRDDFKKELEIANYRLKGKRHPDDNGIMADGEVDVKAVTEQRDKAWQKIENQAERITYLEGATNHATGTPLSKAIEQRDRLAAALQNLCDSLLGNKSSRDITAQLVEAGKALATPNQPNL